MFLIKLQWNPVIRNSAGSKKTVCFIGISLYRKKYFIWQNPSYQLFSLFYPGSSLYLGLVISRFHCINNFLNPFSFSVQLVFEFFCDRFEFHSGKESGKENQISKHQCERLFRVEDQRKRYRRNITIAFNFEEVLLAT